MTDHMWNPTASALCSCGESPSRYSLPTDSAQWMKWEVWHREHLEVSEVQMTATDSERVEQIRARLGLAGPPDEGSCAEEVTEMLAFAGVDSEDIGPDADLISAAHADLAWLLARLAEQAATIREQVAQAIEAERDAQAALRPISDAMYYGYTKAADAARTAALGSQRTEGQ